MDIKDNTINNLIDEHHRIIIAGHVNPDGDAVGACFAFAQAVEALGKQPVVLLGSYSERYSILKGEEYIYKGDYSAVAGDLFVALDTASKERLGKAQEVFDRTPVTINIDHHVSNIGYADYNLIQLDVSSASEIVYNVVLGLTEVHADIGACIYSGILSDTGGFRHSCTTSVTHEIISKLIETGIPFSQIYRETMAVHSILEAKMLSQAIKHMKLLEGYPVTYSYITMNDMKAAGAVYSDLDGIVEYLLNVKGTEVSFLVTEREDGLKGSLRSTEVNVNKIASLFGGGGHVNAAGCSMSEPLDMAIEKLLFEIKKAFVHHSPTGSDV